MAAETTKQGGNWIEKQGPPAKETAKAPTHTSTTTTTTTSTPKTGS